MDDSVIPLGKKPCRCCGDVITDDNRSPDEGLSPVYIGRCRQSVVLFQFLVIGHVNRGEPLTAECIWGEVWVNRLVEKAPSAEMKAHYKNIISDAIKQTTLEFRRKTIRLVKDDG